MTDVDGAMRQEIETLLPGSDPLQNISLSHTGGTTYVALDARDASLTAYTVDLNAPSCTCPYFQEEVAGGKVCPHMALAMMDHPERMEVEAETVTHLFRQVHELNTVVSQLQAFVADSNPDLDGGSGQPQAADGGETATEPKSQPQPDQSPEPDTDPVEAVEEWLSGVFASPEKVRVERGDHGGDPGVRLHPNNQEMKDPVYETFKSLVGDVDGSTVHVGFTDEGCQYCGGGDSGFWYHIPEGRARAL